MLIEEKKLDWLVFKLCSKLRAGHLYTVRQYCWYWDVNQIGLSAESSLMGVRYTFYRPSTYHYLISHNTCCYSKLRIDKPCLHHDVDSSSIVFLCMSMHCESLQMTCWAIFAYRLATTKCLFITLHCTHWEQLLQLYTAIQLRVPLHRSGTWRRILLL